MKVFEKSKVVGLLLLGCGLMGQVNARTVNLGAVSGDASRSIYDQSMRGAFADAVTFRLSELSDAGGAAIESGAGIVSATLDSIAGTLGDARPAPWTAGGAYSFAQLAPGITRTLSGVESPAGFYRNVLDAAATAPGAETGLMAIIGLGLVAFQLRRTQRLLQHRPLAG